MNQIGIFDGSQPLKIKKPIRLIECFAGYGSQALSLKYLGVDFEQGKIVELPCQIGRTVYCIRYDKARKPFVKPLGVCSVTVWGKGGLTVFTTKEDSWGVTAFATPEEAKAKLREMEGAGE